MGGIQRQVQLPLSKAIEIALRSLRVRLTRSVLTLITIIMAITFLANVWATSVCEPMIRRAAGASLGVAMTGAAEPAGDRTVWLLSLSLLVCMVGISNAMLMSVMERFREIGTMKCLGALDSFILKLFLMESLFLGAAGTAIGVLLGLIFAVIYLVRTYGGVAWTQMPWGTLWAIAGGSGAIGIAITAAAALYPAWRAARMEPVSAMRVDV